MKRIKNILLRKILSEPGECMYGPPEWYYGDSLEKDTDETTEPHEPDSNRLKELLKLLKKDKKHKKDTDND